MTRLEQIVAALPPDSDFTVAQDRRKAAVYRGMLALMQHVDDIAAHADDELIEMLSAVLVRARQISDAGEL
jgi:hypothetical protein